MWTKADELFIKALKEIIKEGYFADEETVRTKWEDGSSANYKYLTFKNFEFDLSKNEFPISTLRPIFINKAIDEMLAIWIDGANTIDAFEKRGISWWKPWDIGDGTIGHRYGYTVKHYDILKRTIDGLKLNPFNRRSVMTMFQYQDLDSTSGLMPCAYEASFDVRKTENETLLLDMQLNQRSSDFLVAGLGINQMQYVALQLIVCAILTKETKYNWNPGKFIWNVHNLHIYDRHFDQAQDLINRFENYKDFEIDNSKIKFELNSLPTKLKDLTSEDFELQGYNPIKPQLKFPLAI